MSEKYQIEIFTASEPPDNERTVAVFDSSIEQWAEGCFLNGDWLDAEGKKYWKDVVTKWFDYPDENIQVLEMTV